MEQGKEMDNNEAGLDSWAWSRKIQLRSPFLGIKLTECSWVSLQGKEGSMV